MYWFNCLLDLVILPTDVFGCEFESRSWRGVLNTTLYDQVCQWLTAGPWFSPVSSTKKTDRHDIAEILFKVALNTITLILYQLNFNRNGSGRFGAVKSDSTHNFFGNACTKSVPLQFSPVFRLLNDFVCWLMNFAFPIGRLFGVL